MSSTPLVACLTVTNRPEWGPFCRFQVAKQVGFSDAMHIIVSDERATIATLRSYALADARRHRARYVAWFDDDDWSSPQRLLQGVAALEDNPSLAAFGNVRSWFISTDTKMGLEYQAPEGIIFNGAVFRLDRVPQDFKAALVVGEDTEWLGRFHMTRPSYFITGHYLHAWLCHRRNITNRSDTKAFDQTPPTFLSAVEWGLVP